jgi:hypothetical protein
MIDSLLAVGAQLTGFTRFLLMLPLCLSVAIAYKVTRIDNLREALAAALILWVTIVIGMIAVGVGLWLLFQIMA